LGAATQPPPATDTSPGSAASLARVAAAVVPRGPFPLPPPSIAPRVRCGQQLPRRGGIDPGMASTISYQGVRGQGRPPPQLSAAPEPPLPSLLSGARASGCGVRPLEAEPGHRRGGGEGFASARCCWDRTYTQRNLTTENLAQAASETRDDTERRRNKIT